jgi:hypothetical protein
MKKAILAMGIVMAMGCSDLKSILKTIDEYCKMDPTAPFCQPSPSPSPTAAPTPPPEPCDPETNTLHEGLCRPQPSPEPSPSPTVAPGCGLPVPQEQYTCEPGTNTLSVTVHDAVAWVIGHNPRFEVDIHNDALVWLLRADGSRARREEPGAEEARQWFYATVVARLQSLGYCAGSFGTDQLMVGVLPGGPFRGYHLINHGGGNVQFSPPLYTDSCTPILTIPTPGPISACPAPPVAKFRLHVSHPDTYPRGRRVDATPLAAGEAWCASQGFLDPDGSGQGFCPLGPEGSAQRVACEDREGPYTWSGTPDTVGNPLQAFYPRGFRGVVTVCARRGWCGEVEL